MISIKRYLDGNNQDEGSAVATLDEPALQAAMRRALRSIFTGIGNASVVVCATAGIELRAGMATLEDRLAVMRDPDDVTRTEDDAMRQLSDWGARSAELMHARTVEVKDILLVLAGTAESLARRDQRCADQMGQVTTKLNGIASLDDLTEIRATIERTAEELRTTMDSMTSEGKSAVEHLRQQVRTYQEKLEAAEYAASYDALTGLGSRLWVESQLQKRIDAGTVFSSVVLDLDDFKRINDTYGHLAGDEALKQFARELKSACRGDDVLGRWGGDEFIVLLDNALDAAEVQTKRLQQWVCGKYAIETRSGQVSIDVCASIGLAEYRSGESIKDLFDRADAAMYAKKSNGRSPRTA
ncbi:MAG: GGDEF domain-containing protein [Acidobacteriota bacterium]|nr:GGDEF domain-containing protein [Acidobacteriota bacterium]